MSFLPKNRQKRNQLFLALGATVLLIVGIAFGVVRPQYIKLAGIKKQTVASREKLKGYLALIHQSASSASELAALTSVLSTNEEDMATGDSYAWTIDTIHHFKENYKVEVPGIGQPSISAMDLLPHFPYRQLAFTLRGTGYYHDLGKFIADLENKYPHMRVVNLEMDPLGSTSEKLSFRMEIVALVKSSS